MAEQLTLFDIPIPSKVYQCDACRCRWLNPLIRCPLCYPDTSHATCEACGTHFADDVYMLELMRLGGDVLCEDCFPRQSTDDYRDQDRLHRDAEQQRRERWAFDEYVRKLRFVPKQQGEDE